MAVTIFSISFLDAVYAEESTLPEWIRNIFLWYGQNEISEAELLGTIQYLITEGIIEVDTTTKSTCPGGDDCPPVTPAEFYGPKLYNSFDDSPFKELKENHFMYWEFEDFEDKLLTVPGIDVIPVPKIGIYRASVDNDDGLKDGNGESGAMSFFDNKVQIKFNESTLGKLPTHVGFVVTGHSIGDKSFIPEFTFEAYNVNGERIISEGGLTSGHDGDKTTDDKFFGAYNKEGIKSIQLVANGKASLQIDHLQYGR